MLAGDSLEARLAGRPGELVGLPLLVDNAVQMLQLIVGRAEPAQKRLMLQLKLPDFFVLCAKRTIRIGPLAGETCFEPPRLLRGPRRELPFECRPSVGFSREPRHEFRLARRRGRECGGRAFFRIC